MEMQSWVEIYNRIPTKYIQYLSVPHSNECPTRAEINRKLTHACTTDSNELADQASITLNFSERPILTSDSLAENWQYNSTTQRDIQLRYGTTYLLNNFLLVRMFRIIQIIIQPKLPVKLISLKYCNQIWE